ncbi:hypothetical protein ACFQU7_12215 [Pseudoroseomonas wenyumeiae]
MSSLTRAVASSPGEGLHTRAFGTYLIRFTAAVTGGGMGLFEMNLPAGEGPPCMSMNGRTSSSASCPAASASAAARMRWN